MDGWGRPFVFYILKVFFTSKPSGIRILAKKIKMRKLIPIILLALVVFFAWKYFESKNEDRDRLEASTDLIQKQIKNVGKLVVTEGNFAQVFTYNDSKSFYLDVFSARKKALIIVNADVTVAYDLSKLQTEVNPETKTVTITYIPEEEISINPNIQYYDVTQDYLNQFEAKDYNKIQKRIKEKLMDKIEKSSLKSNAKNRLVSELQKIYILTNSMGWTLEYNGNQVNSESLEAIKL